MLLTTFLAIHLLPLLVLVAIALYVIHHTLDALDLDDSKPRTICSRYCDKDHRHYYGCTTPAD